MKNYYTWNTFRAKVKDMNDKEKREFISELHLELMKERVDIKKAPTGVSNHIRLYRKQIAYLKTMLNVKGFHYKPRGDRI